MCNRCEDFTGTATEVSRFPFQSSHHTWHRIRIYYAVGTHTLFLILIDKDITEPHRPISCRPTDPQTIRSTLAAPFLPRSHRPDQALLPSA